MSDPALETVLVRGTGAVGLAAALALSRLGLDVSLLGELAERDPPARPDIRAYALNAASVALLQSLKVWDALPADARTAVHEMQVMGDAPGARLEFSGWALSLAELAWIVDAGELDRALRAAVRFAPHVKAVPQPLPATLQVLAEGRDSATRDGLGVQMALEHYGQHAVAARLVSSLPHAGQARQWFRSPDVLALLPTDRAEPGRGLALVWSLPDARAAELLALPDAGFEQALNDATGGAAGVLRLAGPRASWPLAVARASAVHGPGWVLVGDAAHVVHPLAGQGLNLGLADVASLAATLARARRDEPWRSIADPRLLARHARERAAPARAMAAVTDGLLHLFAHQEPWARELRNRGLGLADRLPALKRLLARHAVGA